MEVHGHTKKTLKQRVMQFLSDTRALRESFFKTQIHLPRNADYPPTIESEDRGDAQPDEQYTEPPSSPDWRRTLRHCNRQHRPAGAGDRVYHGCRDISRLNQKSCIVRPQVSGAGP